jgi:hypothetical protein
MPKRKVEIKMGISYLEKRYAEGRKEGRNNMVRN